eukprot:PhF_6_TR37515/c0_g1_i2/m.55454
MSLLSPASPTPTRSSSRGSTSRVRDDISKAGVRGAARRHDAGKGFNTKASCESIIWRPPFTRRKNPTSDELRLFDEERDDRNVIVDEEAMGRISFQRSFTSTSKDKFAGPIQHYRKLVSLHVDIEVVLQRREKEGLERERKQQTLEEEVVTLRKALYSSDQEVNNMLLRVDELAQETKECVERMASYEIMVESSDRRAANASVNITDMERLLQEGVDRANMMEDQVEHYRSEISQLESELSAYRGELQSAQLHIQKFVEELETALTAKEDLEKRLQDLQDQEVEQHALSLRTEDELAMVQQQLQEAVRRNEMLSAELDGVTGEIHGHKVKVVQAESAQLVSQQELDLMEKKHAESARLLLDAEGEIQQLSIQLQAARIRCVELESESNAQRNAVQRIQTEKSEKEKDIAAVRLRVADLEREGYEVERSNQSLREELTSVRSQLRTVERDRLDQRVVLERELALAKRQIELTRSESDLAGHYSRAQNELKSFKDQHQALQEKFTALQAAYDQKSQEERQSRTHYEEGQWLVSQTIKEKENTNALYKAALEEIERLKAVEDFLRNAARRPTKDVEVQWDDPKLKENVLTLEQYVIPLNALPNPGVFRSYFFVSAYVSAAHSSLRAKVTPDRVWVVDHFNRSLIQYDDCGRFKMKFPSAELLQVEKSLNNSRRLLLVFQGQAHVNDIMFITSADRERFYETTMAIRPCIRVYAPSLTKPGSVIESVVTTIDGIENMVEVTEPNLSVAERVGTVVPFTSPNRPEHKVTLSGRCVVNTSKHIHERMHVFCGTLNLEGGHAPVAGQIVQWLNPGKFDIYLVAAQCLTYQKKHGEWEEFLQHHLGSEYLVISSSFVFDTYLISFIRRKHILKITNSETIAVASSFSKRYGGVAMSFRFMETSYCIIAVDLPIAQDASSARLSVLKELNERIKLGYHGVEAAQQFHYTFMLGTFNSVLATAPSDVLQLCEMGDFEQLLLMDELSTTLNNREINVLHEFNEVPIQFAPNCDTQSGQLAYTERIVFRVLRPEHLEVQHYGTDATLPNGHKLLSLACTTEVRRPVFSTAGPIDWNTTHGKILSFQSIEAVRHDSVEVRNPTVSFYHPFTDEVDVPTATKKLYPQWEKSEIPALYFAPIPDVELNLMDLHIILREASDRVFDKQGAGCAVLPLNKCKEQPTTIELDWVFHGRCVGAIYVTVSLSDPVMSTPQAPSPKRARGRWDGKDNK